MSKTTFVFVTALALLWLASPTLAADPGKGNILIEEWTNTGNAVNNDVTTLKAYINAGNQPTRSYWTKSFDRPDGGEDYWGGRFRGYLYPPQTGDYTFWTCSDDDSEIWLSTDEAPANVKMIANVEGWMPYLAWDGAGGSPGTTFKSQPVKLEAGKRYYVETYFSDGTGGGFQTVGWGGPGIGAGPVVIAGKYLAPVIRTPEPLFKAQNPQPADGAIGVTAPLLTWTAGPTAMFHDVYFGTDPNPPQVASRQLFAMYYHIAGLTPGATYYWRVNEIEVDGTTIHEGPLWSFVAQAETAYYPTPADGTPSVTPNLTLTWQPGKGVLKHQVYLSDSLDAVTQGAAAADKGQTEETSFTPTDLLGATTYYWRVDEIGAGGTVKAGSVWSFTTFILVDDFEGYNDDLAAKTTIFDTWIDGLTNGLSGSTVGNAQAPFAEQRVIHGGAQAMPLFYDNSKSPFYSETEKALSPVQDWTANGVDTLSVWLQGRGAAFAQTAADRVSMSGGGHDIWDNADDFRFAYKTLTGDGTMVARVVGRGPGTNNWAKGGVMIRATNSNGSTHAMTVVTGGDGNGASFQRRLTTNGASSNSDAPTRVTIPYWVKIERKGNDFSGYLSPDGVTWTQLGTAQTIVMTGPVLIGLCVTSHVTGELRSYEFDSIATTGNVTGTWKVEDIGAPEEMTGNSLEPVYVVITDSANKSAVIQHPDPAASLSLGWSEWKIPLSSITGVNLAKVKTVAIGVGKKTAPVAGGSGCIFVDDIRVTKP